MSPTTSASEESLNDRLRRRREEFGASIPQVARWAALDTKRLAKIEEGSSMDSWEFDAICRALAVDGGALARGLDRSPRRSVARFKSASWVHPEPGDFRTLSLAAELGRIGGFLAKRLGRANRLADLRAPEPVAARSEPWKQGYRLGENARRSLAQSSGPIHELEELLAAWGVHIARVEFSSSHLDAASLWEGGSLPVILLNARSSRTRSSLSRRALLAHELCHLLHDSGDKDRDLTTQLSWSENAGNYREAVEQRARAFGPAFLAPRDEVRHWFQAGPGKLRHDPKAKVEELARRWGFSLRGAVWHAKNSGIISSAVAEELERSASGEEHEWGADFEQGHVSASAAIVEEGESSSIARGLLSTLVAEAVATGVISEGRGHEIVTWQ